MGWWFAEQQYVGLMWEGGWILVVALVGWWLVLVEVEGASEWVGQ